jgi:DNA-binding transcriptional LysR family regulator
VQVNGRDKETLTFAPLLSMNDFAGLATALLAGAGIGELPPVVRPELVREGRLVEVMTDWRFATLPLSVVHLGSRHVPQAVSVIKDFAAQMAPKLFPELAT